MKRRHASILAPFLALACTAPLAADTCSCWGGGSIVGMTQACGSQSYYFGADDCPNGGVLWCKITSPGCTPYAVAACCPPGAYFYYGCRDSQTAFACCSGGQPAWEYNAELGLWGIAC